MALIYLFPLLLLLQATAVPLDSTEMTTTEMSFFNGTSEPENGTDTDVTILPLANLTSINETVEHLEESTTVDVTSEATTTEDQVIETTSFTSEPEATVTNPPPTKKANIDDGNMAVMAQAGALAFVLPVCVRLVTLWNRCL